MRSTHRKLSPAQCGLTLVMFSVAVVWALPIVWALLTTFKTEAEIKGPFSFIPRQWTLESYTYVLQNTGNTPVLRWFLNSLVISTVSSALIILVVSMSAYGFTRLWFKGQNTLFYTVMALSFFPQIINIIPLFRIMTTLDWVNTMWAVIVPAVGGVTNIFLVRQFLLGVPRDMDEAARIDGANEFMIYARIIIPCLKPVLTVVGLFSFTAAWNDLLWPTIVFNDVAKMPLTPGLQLLMGAYGNFYLGAMMTAAIIALVPTFVLYLFAQKYFLQSLSLGSAVKG